MAGSLRSASLPAWVSWCAVLLGVACGSTEHSDKPAGGAGAPSAAGAGGGSGGVTAAAGGSTPNAGVSGSATAGGSGGTSAAGANAAGTAGSNAAGAAGMNAAGFPATQPCVFMQPRCPGSADQLTCGQAGTIMMCWTWGTCQSTPSTMTCCAGSWRQGATCP